MNYIYWDIELKHFQTGKTLNKLASFFVFVYFNFHYANTPKDENQNEALPFLHQLE